MELTEPTEVGLAAAGLMADEHFLDRGYVSAALQAISRAAHSVELNGLIHEDVTWQGRAGEGFDVNSFTIDWGARQLTCPQGHSKFRWKPHRGRLSLPESDGFFSPQYWLPCPVREP
ncbi:hypothetical protein ACWCQP_47840 [Streptomyces chartreusis]